MNTSLIILFAFSRQATMSPKPKAVVEGECPGLELEAALHSAQGTLTFTKDDQARLEVTTPGKDALPRAKTLTDTKKLYAYRYDNDGKLAATTERAFACA